MKRGTPALPFAPTSIAVPHALPIDTSSLLPLSKKNIACPLPYALSPGRRCPTRQRGGCL